MHTFLLALHVLFAVFAVGPLVGAASAAPRALRAGDASRLAEIIRMVRVYSVASVLVVLIGFGLMSTKDDHKPSFTETWIWLSVVLWVIGVGAAWFGLVPALQTRSAGRAEASVGLVTLTFGVIVFLMVYRP